MMLYLFPPVHSSIPELMSDLEKFANDELNHLYKLIADLEVLNILKEMSGAQRNKLYIFKDYLDLFKNN